MPCKPLKPMNPEDIGIRVELQFNYDRLKLIHNGDDNHPFMKGFKFCQDIIENRIDILMQTNTSKNGKRKTNK
jgi:hypothetical protein